MQRTSLFKRKRNRIPINLLSKQRVSAERSRITRKIVTVSLPERNEITTLTDASDSWDNDDNNLDTGDTQCYQEDDTETSVSAYTKRKQKLAEKWNSLRNDAYKMMVQSKALLPNQKCCSCDVDNANIRCQQCGPLLMCHKCCETIHSKLHYHHFPEMWQVQSKSTNILYFTIILQDNCFVPLKLPPATILICSHDCDSKYFRKITCFHVEGEKILCITCNHHVW